jgi:SAM-dependent methyltransferase/acyl carrier protein
LPKFEKFFQFILQILSDDDLIAIQGSELTFQVNLEDIQSITQMREAIISAVPELEESLDYLGNCVSKYGEALSGEIEAISVLYPEGRGADMIRPEEDDSYTYTNQRLYVNVLAETISGMLLKEPGKPLRILEIGGGNGYLTQAVTELVKDRNVEYFFTDLGPSLVRYSEENAIQKGYDSFMQFGVLDISTDCCEQGFEAHRFDLIMGLDVVHATPHISETVRNLKMLLAPEGLLCLIEPVKQQRWIDLAGGLAEGWWYFEDYELRNLSPLLNFAQWEHVLEQQGFPNIRSFPDSKEARDRTDAGLFIAQQSSYCSIDESAVLDDREQWIAHRIRAIFALEANGAETYLFDIGHQEDLGGVVEALNKTFQKVDGVIHDLDMGQPFDWITPLHPKQMILHGVKETLERSPETYASLVSANYWMEQNSASIEQSALLECSFGEDRGSFSDYACVLHDVFTQGLQGSYTLIRQHTEQPFREEKAIAGSISKTVHQRPNLMNEYVAPRNEIERTVVGIWEKVLGVNQIGIYDEFAGLGGDSLIAIRITARIRDALNVQVPVMTLMQQPTVAALSENIAAHLISQPGVEEEVNDEEDFVEGKL